MPAARQSSMRLIFYTFILTFAIAFPGGTRAQSGDANAFTVQGMALYRAGRYREAELPLRLAFGIVHARMGLEHRYTAAALNNLALLYDTQGRYGEAEPLYRLALAINVKVLGPVHPETAGNLNNLAVLYLAQGRHGEAEPLYKQALAIREKVLGAVHPGTATSLNNLAVLYRAQGRYGEAEPLYKRALAIRKMVLGLVHPDTATSFNNLANLYRARGRYGEAEPLYERALAIRKMVLGLEHPETADSFNDLAGFYSTQGRHGEAEPFYKRALAINKKVLGPEHPHTADSLSNLAVLYSAQGHYREAEPLYKRALAIRKKVLGLEHPETADGLTNLAALHMNMKNWGQAWKLSNRAIEIRIKRVRLARRDGTNRQGRKDINRESPSFLAALLAATGLAREQPQRRSELGAESYRIGQWRVTTRAGAALAQMAARFAEGQGELADLVRRHQDILARLDAIDRNLVAAASKPPSQRVPGAESNWRKQQTKLTRELADVTANIRAAFPDYAAVVNPDPLSVQETQELLGPDEAIYQVIPGPAESWAWVVTADGMRWRPLPVTRKELEESVTALRCGLDTSEWKKDRGLGRTTGETRKRCRDLLGKELEGRILPFDLERAHRLYRTLFGPFEDLIAGKRLLLVPTGPLATMPFQVLVTKAPDTSLKGPARYEQAAWMLREHALTVLPSVASLKSLRRNAGRSRGEIPYAGIANPLLLGSSGSDRRAWDHQACPKPRQTLAQRLADLVGLRATIPDILRKGKTDVALIRAQTPLPETADEVCRVRNSLGGGEIFLGERATETVIKAASAKGELRRFRVLHFATHGLLAGETKDIANIKGEPALILTPPDKASEEDDGLLMASEITKLDLDADLVVLSACNTASGSGEAGTRALSGLARAFLYAGSRSLLVSHWYVNSQAAVDLVTTTFEGKGGRAEALRRAMLGEIGKGGHRAHPSYWAPFVLVGAGG